MSRSYPILFVTAEPPTTITVSLPRSEQDFLSSVCLALQLRHPAKDIEPSRIMIVKREGDQGPSLIYVEGSASWLDDWKEDQLRRANLTEDVQRLKEELRDLKAARDRDDRTRLIEQRPAIMYSILYLLLETGDGPQPRASKQDHPKIRRLLNIVKSKSQAYNRLIARSTIASRYFAPKPIQTFLAAIKVLDRNVICHIEARPVRFLSLALELENLRREEWIGEKNRCPEVIALRLLLCAWGPSRSKELIHELRVDNGRTYAPLREAQIQRLNFLLV